MSDDPGQREVAYRLFAAEYDDANYSYSESDEERAPNYVVTPTGARVNRLFAVGVLTEVEAVSDDVLRGRVADPTGAFVLYAGQYQPDEQATLERTDPPAFVAVTGKADTFQPEDSDRVYTSIRPESINTVDAETRDRWTVQAAEQTLARVGHVATALSTGLVGSDLRETLADRGVDLALADGIPRALAHYDTTPAYLDEVRRLALDAARVVAGQRDEVREMSATPDDPGDVTAAELVAATPETDLDADRSGLDDSASDTATGMSSSGTTETDANDAGQSETGPETTTAEVTPSSGASADSGPDHSSGTSVDSEPDHSSGASVDSEPDHSSGASADSGPDPDSGVESEPETATGVGAGLGDTGDDIAVDTGTDGVDEELGEFESGEFELPDEVREEVEEAEEEFGTSFQSGTEVDEPGEADIPTPEPETPASDAESTASTAEDADTGTAAAGKGATETATETSPGESAGSVTAETTDTEPAETEPADADATADAEAADTEAGDTEAADAEAADTEAGDTEAADAEAADTEAGDTEAGGGGESTEDPQVAVLAVMEDLDDGTGADRAAVVDGVRERHGLTDDEIEDAIQGALMDGKCYEPDESSLKPI